MTERKATLTIDGIDEPLELPVYEGTLGPAVIDVGKLVSKGVFTYDPGFYLHRCLRVHNHIHRRRQGCAAAPWILH